VGKAAAVCPRKGNGRQLSESVEKRDLPKGFVYLGDLYGPEGVFCVRERRSRWEHLHREVYRKEPFCMR